MPHTIRLRHPWQCTACAGGACWQRSFNWPAALSDGETAELWIENLPPNALVRLNDQSLSATAAGRFEVTSILSLHNRLSIEIPAAEPSTQTECPYPVSLQIVEP